VAAARRISALIDCVNVADWIGWVRGAPWVSSFMV
jgi:hypothetical protein